MALQRLLGSPTTIRLVLAGRRDSAAVAIESLSSGAVPPPSSGRRLARIYEMRID